MGKVAEPRVVGVAWAFATGFNPTLELAVGLHRSPASVLQIFEVSDSTSESVCLIQTPIEKLPTMPNLGDKDQYLMLNRPYPLTSLQVKCPGWATLKWKFLE